MIRITDQEKIKAAGAFKLDGLLIKNFNFSKQTTGNASESLVVEAVPFSKLDNDELMAYPNKVYKIALNDIQAELLGSRISATTKALFVQAYFATEKAVAGLMTELENIKCVFEEPKS